MFQSTRKSPVIKGNPYNYEQSYQKEKKCDVLYMHLCNAVKEPDFQYALSVMWQGVAMLNTWPLPFYQKHVKAKHTLPKICLNAEVT